MTDPRDGAKHGLADVLRSLTRAQRYHVKRGCVSGDFQIRTVVALKSKGLMHLRITSPNGQWGVMELTPLGVEVQSLIKSRAQAEPQP